MSETTAVAPTVGRVVHYTFHASEAAPNRSNVVPAIITAVWGPDCVNLRIFADQEPIHEAGNRPRVNEWRTSVMRRTDATDTDCWEFPARV